MRATAGLLVGLAFLLGTAGPAAADGGRPSSFESVVDTVNRSTPGVRIEVVGGDAFLSVSARRGNEVLIPGYDGEPYLRIRRDGVVERNLRSPATYLNTSRSNQATKLPAAADSSAAPRWQPTGGVGQVAWHDHRIHWMTSAVPEPGPGGLIQNWAVPMTVNGRSVVAEGRLLYRGSTASPLELVWIGLVLAAVTAGTAMVARRRNLLHLALFVGATIALGLSWAAFRANPPDSGASLLPVLVAVGALLLVAAAPGLPRVPLALGSAATLVGWAVVRSAVLWKPVLPTSLPGWIDRVGTATVLGIGIGAAWVLVRHPAGVAQADGPDGPDGPGEELPPAP